MKTLLIAALLLSSLLYSIKYHAQNVGINSTNATPDASAILDISSTNKGLLIPRVALTGTTDVTTITTAATSLLVYNTATVTDITPGYYHWNGTVWLRMINTGNASGGDWALTGNAGTIAGTNFIGTTDAQDIVLKTNSAENMRILNSNGNVGIGTPTPNAKLEVNGQLKITGGAPGNGKILTSDAVGLASWQTFNAIPQGAIAMWSGTLASIPTGWALCDGANGTPNLLNRFIMGVGTAENPGATGGNSTYALTTAQLPAHTHTGSGTTSTGGAHTHTMPGYHLSGAGSIPWYNWANSTFVGNTNTTSSSGNHNHTFSFTTSAAGSGAIIDNKPAYYKLAYIMKL